MRFPTVSASLISMLSLLVFHNSLEMVEGFSTAPPLQVHSLRATTYGRSTAVPSSTSSGNTAVNKNRRVEQFQLQATTMDSSSTNTVPSSLFQGSAKPVKTLGKISAALTKIGMMLFITSMCLTLPIALFPPFILHRVGLITKLRQEQMSLRAGQFCARWLLRLIPFCKIHAVSAHHNKLEEEEEQPQSPEPSIWVCNHSSQLDVFMLLAADKKLRGKRKRPMKIVYWKQLEDNPITKLLFQQCGFIPVQMTANKAGEDNDYDLASFKNLLKQSKRAFEEGFDIGILPEGQLNPNPEESLLPCFPGAFTLARMSKRPIQMMALHGTHRLWHAREDIGMTVTGREVRIRVYPNGRKYKSGDEFLATFNAVVGQFATKGFDLHKEDLQAWLDGEKWNEMKSASAEP